MLQMINLTKRDDWFSCEATQGKMQGKIQYVQEINIGRLDARICKDDMATGPSLAGTAAAVATGSRLFVL